MVEIELDTSELQKWVEEKRMLLAIELEREVVLKITQMGLVDTGHFRNSVANTARVEGDWSLVHTDVKYAPYLEYGTSTHFVAPVNKKALHWKKGNKNFFSKGHMVKGIQAYAPFRRALSTLIARLPTLLK